MDPRKQRIEAIFGAALELATPEQREVYLARTCGDDTALRLEIEQLIQAYHKAGRFLTANEEHLEAAGATVLLPVTEKAGDRIGRYKLLQQIGEGGCGVVYMAEQEEPVRRRVALKVIKLGMDTKQVIARFEAERQALALMDHPNIAKVLDAGATETGRPYFVMELVRGIKITDYCDQKHLSTRERLDLFIQVCHAVQHAHQKGIIHRDIKPSNILVSQQDGGPVPVVIDFGIAKATAQQQLTDKTLFTAFEQFIGTPAYMSPEQAEMSRLDVDTRSDIYSLGVLLYELLAGKTPFDAKTLLAAGLDEMRRTIREQEPARPSMRLSTMADAERTAAAQHRQSEVPKLIHLLRGDLDWIVMKCLEKDRVRRYETANGLAADLERHLQHEPVVARPASTAYRVQKFVRRNKVMVGAAASVAGVLVLGILVSTWQAIRATKAERDQLRMRQAAQTAQANEARQRRRAEASEQSARHDLYVASMNLAQQAFEQNNVGRVRDLLKETASNPARGFEWYYWQRQLHLDLQTLHGHSNEVLSAAFSPDGQRIVTGSSDKTAKVWDAASGKELLTLKGHKGAISSVAFSPDGQRIGTGSSDKTAKLWDAASGKELLTLEEHSNIASVAFSPDGQRIATGGGQTARVWDAARGKLFLTLAGHSGDVTSVAFSPDGQRIVTGSGDYDQTAKVWDAARGQELFLLKGRGNLIRSVAFSPDGQRIVTGSFFDGTAKVWDAANGNDLRTLQGRSFIMSVAFSPDGQRIVGGSVDETGQVWDVASGKEVLTLRGHRGPLYSVAFSPDGQRIVTGSYDGTAKVWDATGSKEFLTLNLGHGITSLVVSPDGQRIVAGTTNGMVSVWDAASGRGLLTFQGHSNMIWSVALSPDGERIATGSADQTARVWDAATGTNLCVLKGHTSYVGRVAFSPDGQRIATCGPDGVAKVWDLATGNELLTFRRHRAMVNYSVFSPDGQRIVSGSDDGTTRVWDAASGKELLKIPERTPLQAGSSIGAWSRDGRWIVTGTVDGWIRAWDTVSGTNLITFRGHTAPINAVAFSPDGRRIATASGDQTAKLWDAASGKELISLRRYSGADVAFSPDGQRIVTWGNGPMGATVSVWEAATGEQVAAWQREETADAERLAALQREQAAVEQERAARPGAIRLWLVLAPITIEGESHEAALKALDQEQIAHEASLRPRAGDRVKVAESELVWTRLQRDDSLTDFNQLLGKESEWSVAYAVCYIQSGAKQTGLLLKVGSDDEAKIYLNQKEIYRNETARACVPDQDPVEGVELKAGLNVLVFKVVNEILDWQGSIRFTDVRGNPVKGIQVTLDPEGKDLR